MAQPVIFEDVVDERAAGRLAATLGAAPFAPPAPRLGAPLPPLWHWIYFLEAQPPGALGRDGHPRRTGTPDPAAYPRRQWAGGEVSFLAPLPVGASGRRVTRRESLTEKQGRSGPLAFVALRHELFAGETLTISERQDIVYRGGSGASAGAAAGGAARLPGGGAAAEPADWSDAVTPDATLLFRFSALTFNGHRIHYDADYCRQVEGYPGLVTHGPLIALLMLGAGVARRDARALRRFRYRAEGTAFAGETILFEGRADAEEQRLWARTADGRRLMSGAAVYAPSG